MMPRLSLSGHHLVAYDRGTGYTTSFSEVDLAHSVNGRFAVARNRHDAFSR
jgi:hypothetical protein